MSIYHILYPTIPYKIIQYNINHIIYIICEIVYHIISHHLFIHLFTRLFRAGMGSRVMVGIQLNVYSTIIQGGCPALSTGLTPTMKIVVLKLYKNKKIHEKRKQVSPREAPLGANTLNKFNVHKVCLILLERQKRNEKTEPPDADRRFVLSTAILGRKEAVMPQCLPSFPLMVQSSGKYWSFHQELLPAAPSSISLSTLICWQGVYPVSPAHPVLRGTDPREQS